MLFHFSFVGQEYEQLGDSSVPCGINRAYLVVPAEGAWSGGSLPHLAPGQRHWMAGFIWNSHMNLSSRTCLTWTTHLEPVHLTWTTHLGPLQHGGLGVAKQLIWWLRTPRASVPFKHLSWKCQGPPWANLWGPRSHFCLIWLVEPVTETRPGVGRRLPCLPLFLATSQRTSDHFWSTMVLSCSVMSLCDPLDCSLPGSSVHGILLARILEWVAISSSRGSSQPRDQTW